MQAPTGGKAFDSLMEGMLQAGYVRAVVNPSASLPTNRKTTSYVFFQAPFFGKFACASGPK